MFRSCIVAMVMHVSSRHHRSSSVLRRLNAEVIAPKTVRPHRLFIEITVKGRTEKYKSRQVRHLSIVSVRTAVYCSKILDNNLNLSNVLLSSFFQPSHAPQCISPDLLSGRSVSQLQWQLSGSPLQAITLLLILRAA